VVDLRTLRLVVEYDGTPFFGWQRLPGRPTVQGELERAVFRVTGERAAVVGAGRTDAGAHALGQVAHVRLRHRLPAARFPAALNAYLPDAIRVLAADDVDPRFHARRSAVGRTYWYLVLNRPQPSAVLRHHAHFVPAPLDVEAMRGVLAALRGRRDFRAFGRPGPDGAVCDLRVAEVRRVGPLVVFAFEADRFLQHMVRRVVGTVLRVGRGALSPDEVARMVDAGGGGGPRAPARGLYLVRVIYEGSPVPQPPWPGLVEQAL
jgi:tRNA pseudouridine38-40 synthase